jgi:hypothetical protein
MDKLLGQRTWIEILAAGNAGCHKGRRFQVISTLSQDLILLNLSDLL